MCSAVGVGVGVKGEVGRLVSAHLWCVFDAAVPTLTSIRCGSWLVGGVLAGYMSQHFFGW